ncbi:polysaccharide deacetylase family protein [Edaphobacter paludis]|uniref:Polysaccharide deacetylase family protein n=1 Tax=Edaphobacter paludis TaxID=3035702 RepID=A0AAU7D4A0_9BACT
MSLSFHLGALRSHVLCSVFCRPVSLCNQRPLVSFCFDDFPRTAYTVGGTILKSFGVHGTFYAAPRLIDTTNGLGDQLTRDDIDSLLTDGHELGCQTFSHLSYRALPLSTFELEVLKGRKFLRELTGYDPCNFAYPQGHVSLRCKRRLGPQMSSSRGTCSGINIQIADLNLLRANSLYGDLDQMDRIESLLSHNVSGHGWLIFYTHDVRRNHSPFGCTPALLDGTLLLAMKKGCRIASIKEAISTHEIPETPQRRAANVYDRAISGPGSA